MNIYDVADRKALSIAMITDKDYNHHISISLLEYIIPLCEYSSAKWKEFQYISKAACNIIYAHILYNESLRNAWILSCTIVYNIS